MASPLCKDAGPHEVMAAPLCLFHAMQAMPALLADPKTSPLRNVRQLLLEIHFPPMMTASLAPLATQKAVNDMFIGLHKLGFGVFAKIGVSGQNSRYAFARDVCLYYV